MQSKYCYILTYYIRAQLIYVLVIHQACFSKDYQHIELLRRKKGQLGTGIWREISGGVRAPSLLSLPPCGVAGIRKQFKMFFHYDSIVM